ncbi:MAG: MFS transporter [Chloroflexi bacterium]|nr:MFS transporter [Chloroflexota bacterium]MDA1228351.1 MFS transporter [Chloroflexota bacterium]
MSLNPALLLRTALRAPAMRIRDFRFLFASAVFDAIGFTGEMVVLGWLVLELTNSPFMVGVALSLRSAPFFFLGMPAGAIADRVSRRDLMRILNVGMVVVTSAVGVLILSGHIQTWHLLVSAVITGSSAALYHTSRQSFVHDIVGVNNLVSGLAFLSLGMRVGGFVSAVIVGRLIVQVSPSAAYFLLAAGYLASATALTLVSTRGEAALSARQPIWSSLKEFGGELSRNRSLLVLILVTIGIEVMGFATATALPSLARDVLYVGADGLGDLIAWRSVGAIFAVLLVSLLGEVSRRGLLLLLCMIVFGVAVIMLGLSPTFAVALFAIAIIGGMMSLTDLFTQSLMQSVVRNEQRGRAMGAWVVGVGTAPLGTLQVGYLAATFSVSVALVSNGVGLAFIGVAVLLLLPKIRRL